MMVMREEINAVKEMLKDTRGYYKLLDAINECIGATASNFSEEENIDEQLARIALGEMVYDRILSDEDLDEEIEYQARELIDKIDLTPKNEVANEILTTNIGTPDHILEWAHKYADKQEEVKMSTETIFKQCEGHIANAINEYRWTTETTEQVRQEWREYCDTEPTIADICDVLVVFERAEANGQERPSIEEAVWIVADAQ